MKSIPRLALCAVLALAPTLALSRPVAAQDEPKFRIHFDYSKVQESLFTPDVKRMIESGAALLASYINTEGEITITVVDGATVNAYAQGAPSEWETDTAEKSIAKTGGIRFGTKYVIEARDKGVDLTALVMHEIMHCLGSVSSAKAIAKNLKPGGMYEGPNALKMNNGKPVAFDGSHYKQGFEDVHGIVPRISNGGGGRLSILDLAILADLGYEIPLIKNAGDKVPHVTFHFPENYFSWDADDKTRGLRGGPGNDYLEAHSYTVDGKPGSYVLVGGGGDDVLIAGPGEDTLDGNNVMHGDSDSRGNPIEVVAGKATYVLRANCGKVTIQGFKSGRDKIYLDPEKGVDADGLTEALKNTSELRVGPNSIRPGYWAIKAGDFEFIVHTGSRTEKPQITDFVIEEWKRTK
jgi:RTX calcium-binding nonapeptide repeat (4 copies)